MGTLPPEIGQLTNLTSINLRANGLIGTIPSSFRSLTKLQHLALQYNQLTGGIPTWIGELTALSTLVLSNNKLEGQMPSSLFTLSRLTVLAVDDNMLSGSLGQINLLTNLVSAYLEGNSFVDAVDDTFLINLNQLVDLDLSENLLVGTFPPHFFDPSKFPSLTVLDLHGNALTGNIPDTIPISAQLRLLALHENELMGSIPNSITALQGLEHLDLTTNKFTGPMPDSLGSLSSLRYLFLADNTFTPGPIPDTYQNLSLLQDFSVKQTQRTGPIPRWLSGLDQMILLDLDSNSFTGSIPVELTNMLRLRLLLLNRNQLTGGLNPDTFGIFGRLRKYRCSDRCISPTLFQDSNCSCVASGMFLLEENSITGSLDFICDETDDILMASDCGGIEPETTCECCDFCCEDGVACHGRDYIAQIDPIWEAEYERSYYAFAHANITRR